MKLLGAKHTKKNRRHESTFEILLVKQQKFNFLTNLAFKIAKFQPELPILCFTARSLKYLAIHISAAAADDGEKATTIRLSEKSISLPITMPLNTHFWIPLSLPFL
jgi:hypothetical protein